MYSFSFTKLTLQLKWTDTSEDLRKLEENHLQWDLKKTEYITQQNEMLVGFNWPVSVVFNDRSRDSVVYLQNGYALWLKWTATWDNISPSMVKNCSYTIKLNVFCYYLTIFSCFSFGRDGFICLQKMAATWWSLTSIVEENHLQWVFLKLSLLHDKMKRLLILTDQLRLFLTLEGKIMLFIYKTAKL